MPSAGKEGEKRAADYLQKAGMTIIAQNFRSRRGEIDIIAVDGQTIVFVEVKSWAVFGREDLEYSMDLKKQRKIIETAKYFLSFHRKYSRMAIRFDIIFVNDQSVTHLASAFMENV